MQNNFYPSTGWWKTKETIAKRMTPAELLFAYYDCLEAARCLPQEEGKYHDEASIYNRFLKAKKR